MQSISLECFPLIAINFMLKFDYYWSFAWTPPFIVWGSCGEVFWHLNVYLPKIRDSICESSSANWLHRIETQNFCSASCSQSNDCINKLKSFRVSFHELSLLSIFKRTWLSLRKLCHSIMHAGCNIYHLLRFLPNSWLRLQHSSLTPRHRRGRRHSRAAYCLHNPWFASFCLCSH